MRTHRLLMLHGLAALPVLAANARVELDIETLDGNMEAIEAQRAALQHRETSRKGARLRDRATSTTTAEPVVQDAVPSRQARRYAERLARKGRTE